MLIFAKGRQYKSKWQTVQEQIADGARPNDKQGVSKQARQALRNSEVRTVYTNDWDKMTIKEAQTAVDDWIKQYGVRYFSELTNMAVLTEEVGELARVMARKYGDQSFKEGEKDNIGEEIADIFWVLCCIANQTGIDITEELKKSIDKKTKRDKERHINNLKLK